VIDATIAQAQTMKHARASYLVGKGQSRDAITMSAYDATWHMVPSGWPDQNLAFTLQSDIIRDSRFGTMMTRYLAAWKNLIGGDITMFQRVASISTWSLTETDTDIDVSGGVSTNWRWKAITDFAAAFQSVSARSAIALARRAPPDISGLGRQTGLQTRGGPRPRILECEKRYRR
jgi:hypothetical protein